jgi:hypothetical protein
METRNELKCVLFLFTAFTRFIFSFDKYLTTYEQMGLEMEEETHVGFNFCCCRQILPRFKCLDKTLVKFPSIRSSENPRY